MRLLLPTLLVAVVVIVECKHTFMGTSVKRPLLHRHVAKYPSKTFQKRVETYVYSTPPTNGSKVGLNIRGILAYDLTNSSATANITSGGLGYPFVALRMKSESGKRLHYDIYIYG